MNAIRHAARSAPSAGPGPARRPDQEGSPLPRHRRPSGPARHLLLLGLAAALGAAVQLPPLRGTPPPARADQGPTPTPLPTLSGSALPEIAPGLPRPEPLGLVFLDGSADTACAQDQGEGALAGAMVRLKDADGDILRQQLTNAYGLYDLHDAAVSLAAGSYSLDVVAPAGLGLAFRCAKPGTANPAVQTSPVPITSPDTAPDHLLVNVGLQ